MTKAYGVIGAGYGDEGKGRTVDALAHRLLGEGRDVIVVRSNGGAQAGHTVVTPGGRRHVFHHIGSGALAGAPTHLSRFFVHHPMTFGAEAEALQGMSANVSVSADLRGYVTTPYDMMVNQVLETARGGSRHGSCGYGFGETVGRNEETGFGLNLVDLAGSDLRDRLESIRSEWLPARLAFWGVRPDAETAAAMASDDVLEAFVEDCAAFLDRVAITSDSAALRGRCVVFEGAQGLMLDQRSPDFPHVTRSNTGVENMAAIAAETGILRVEAIYATRCYLTRHGSGPMPDMRDLAGLFDIVDATNVPNPWQSSIRHGLLDPDFLADAIRRDVPKALGVDVGIHLSVSCLDQAVGASIPFVKDGVAGALPKEAFVQMLRRRCGAATASAAMGPTRVEQDLSLLDDASLAA